MSELTIPDGAIEMVALAPSADLLPEVAGIALDRFNIQHLLFGRAEVHHNEAGIYRVKAGSDRAALLPKLQAVLDAGGEVHAVRSVPLGNIVLTKILLTVGTWFGDPKTTKGRPAEEVWADSGPNSATPEQWKAWPQKVPGGVPCHNINFFRFVPETGEARLSEYKRFAARLICMVRSTFYYEGNFEGSWGLRGEPAAEPWQRMIIMRFPSREAFERLTVIAEGQEAIAIRSSACVRSQLWTTRKVSS